MTEPDPTEGAPESALDLLTLDPPPYRVVDRHDWGWHTAGGHDEAGAPTYDRDYQDLSLTHPDPLDLPTLPVLLEARGPLRPVIAMPAQDRDRLLSALHLAGRKALLSALVALRRVARDTAMRREAAPAGTYGHPLLGGRGGSHEAYNLVQALGWLADVPDGSPRLDGGAVEAIEAIVGRWISDPGGYVEVAENFSHLLGVVADGAQGRTGLATIADAALCRLAPHSITAWALGHSNNHYSG